MWRLKFPIFITRLALIYARTLFQLILFKLGISKIAASNFLLTLVIAGLAVLLWKMPAAKPPINENLPIDIRLTPEISPVSISLETKALPTEFDLYWQKTQQAGFISQAEYLNLAVLAHSAGKIDQANQLLELSRYIDPNQTFFLEN